MTRTEIAMRISDSLVDSLRGGSPKAWMETFGLDDADSVEDAMRIVATWLEDGRAGIKK